MRGEHDSPLIGLNPTAEDEGTGTSGGVLIPSRTKSCSMFRSRVLEAAQPSIDQTEIRLWLAAVTQVEDGQ